MTPAEHKLIERLCAAIEDLTTVLNAGISLSDGGDLDRLGLALRDLSAELYERRQS